MEKRARCPECRFTYLSSEIELTSRRAICPDCMVGIPVYLRTPEAIADRPWMAFSERALRAARRKRDELGENRWSVTRLVDMWLLSHADQRPREELDALWGRIINTVQEHPVTPGTPNGYYIVHALVLRRYALPLDGEEDYIQFTRRGNEATGDPGWWRPYLEISDPTFYVERMEAEERDRRSREVAFHARRDRRRNPDTDGKKEE